jgi:hypothetical protein
MKSLEVANLQLESEVQSLKLTLEQERAQRRHSHSLANEVITRLDVVGQTIQEVMTRAEEEVCRQRKETPPRDFSDPEMPKFLQNIEALMNGYGDKAEAAA